MVAFFVGLEKSHLSSLFSSTIPGQTQSPSKKVFRRSGGVGTTYL